MLTSDRSPIGTLRPNGAARGGGIADTGRFIVLLPLQDLPHTGVGDALRGRAEALRARQAAGNASPEDCEALRAIDHVLGDDHATGANGNGNGAGELPLLLRVEDVARLLHVSKPHAYNMIARGQVPSVRLGASVRVRRDQLLAWLDEITADQQQGARR
jgi:excisionase family DNA binding protein